MDKICVSFFGGKGYIFDVDDYMKIRTEYRVVGNLVGFNASQARNTCLKGLPAIFTLYELQILLENNCITLLDKSNLKHLPTADHILKYEQFKNTNLEEQKQLQRDVKLNDRRQNLNKIIAAKRKAFFKKNPTSDIVLDPEKILEEEISKTFVFNEKTLLVQIPTQDFLGSEYPTVDIPNDTSLKYRIFKDLWKRGKFITTGESFGGDFLVYPGDPVYFHASHIVHVIERNRKILFTSLTAKGRLSVMVNKILILAYENEENEICYQTIEWQGNVHAKKQEEKEEKCRTEEKHNEQRDVMDIDAANG